MSEVEQSKLVWEKVLEPGDLPEGRVRPVTCHLATVCMTHFEGAFAALDNRCPHQGGPLGEGSIENGWLRCPWHGWDFHPTTGKPPGGYDDGITTYPVEVREDGVYVGFPEEPARERTVSDVMVETMINWGVRQVWGMVGHSNLGLADALRQQEATGSISYYGIRHEGATRRLLLDRGSGRHQSPYRPLGRERRPLTGSGAHRPSRQPGAGAGCLPGGRPHGRVREGRSVGPTRPPDQ